MIGADVLVLLSDIDGLYTADPRGNPAATHIPTVADITPEIEAMAGGSNAEAGTGVGGMGTKLAAARIAHGAGCATLITLGRRAGGQGPLAAVEAGAKATLFEPKATPAAAYKQWIAGTLAPQGVLTVDPGAVTALRAGKSLLPAGVRKVEGRFGKGDAILVLDPSGREVARGLSRYDAAEADKIMGLRSDAIEGALGYTEGPTLIHADDLALAGRRVRA
jgi:glutamate 5-kinase